MRVHIATDHAGFELKERSSPTCARPATTSSTTARSPTMRSTNYPPFCIDAAKAVASEPGSLGVASAVPVTASRWPPIAWAGVRAALVWSDATARLAREHNDANMMAVGARQHSDDEAIALIDAFLETPLQRG